MIRKIAMVCVVGIAIGRAVSGYAETAEFTNRATVAVASDVMSVGTWAGLALKERFMAIGQASNIVPQADSSQDYLKSVKSQIAYLAPRFVCHTSAIGGMFTHYFSLPLTPGGSNYPTEFPMWTSAGLLHHVGAPTNWFDDASWRPTMTDSNGWLFVSNMLSALRWTTRSEAGGVEGIQKYSTGYSTNSYSQAQAQEQASWSSGGYGSSSRDLTYAAAVVVNAKSGCGTYGCRYYINGFRLFRKPVLSGIATSVYHEASWYLLFEQSNTVDNSYITTSYDHPYFNYDGGDIDVDVPHMVYVEALIASCRPAETGAYPFYTWHATDPSTHGYLPGAGYTSLVYYITAGKAHWLIKWDVPFGFQYK